MSNRTVSSLHLGKRLTLATAGAAAIAVPLFGAFVAPSQSSAQSQLSRRETICELAPSVSSAEPQPASDKPGIAGTLPGVNELGCDVIRQGTAIR
jgi:hypothetical protein